MGRDWHPRCRHAPLAHRLCDFEDSAQARSPARPPRSELLRSLSRPPRASSVLVYGTNDQCALTCIFYVYVRHPQGECLSLRFPLIPVFSTRVQTTRYLVSRYIIVISVKIYLRMVWRAFSLSTVETVIVSSADSLTKYRPYNLGYRIQSRIEFHWTNSGIHSRSSCISSWNSFERHAERQIIGDKFNRKTCTTLGKTLSRCVVAERSKFHEIPFNPRALRVGFLTSQSWEIYRT